MNPSTLIATWFGLGFLPKAPGTWGTLGALPFGFFILQLSGNFGLTVAIIIISVLGYWSTGKFQKKYVTHDDPRIVVDEVAGMWIAQLGAGLNPVLTALAFILFRLFDISKPWPCRRLEKLPGAAGVMADDLMAGIYALLCLLVIRYAGFG